MEKTLILKNKISEIGRLVDFVREIGTRMKLTHEEIDELNLVLEEVVSNVIYYAYPKGEEGELEVSVTWKQQQVRIKVTDQGVAFDPTQMENPDLELSMAEMPVGGFGFFLVRQLMDHVSYQRTEGKNQLMLEKSYGACQ